MKTIVACLCRACPSGAHFCMCLLHGLKMLLKSATASSAMFARAVFACNIKSNSAVLLLQNSATSQAIKAYTSKSPSLRKISDHPHLFHSWRTSR
eukprot:4677883-Amphidinium_carterae.1